METRVRGTERGRRATTSTTRKVPWGSCHFLKHNADARGSASEPVGLVCVSTSFLLPWDTSISRNRRVWQVLETVCFLPGSCVSCFPGYVLHVERTLSLAGVHWMLGGCRRAQILSQAVKLPEHLHCIPVCPEASRGYLMSIELNAQQMSG